MIEDIGATNVEVASFFKVSESTIERVLEGNRNEFLMYGEYKKKRKDIVEVVTNKPVGSKISKKSRVINLFNRKHVMLFAINLGQSSGIAKRISHYLIQVEGYATKEDRVTDALESLKEWNDLPSDIHQTVFLNVVNAIREAKGLIAFAEAVSDTTNLISIGDFTKSTYEVLGLGQKKLFREMRGYGILMKKNRPYKYYINAGYFKVITRVIKGKVIYQPMLTGKGEVWLLAKMRAVLGI